MLEVNLRTRSDRPRRALLREITGADELLSGSSDPSSATRLLERLLIDSPAYALGPQDAWGISISDRDRLVASLYAQVFGDLIESQMACESCGKAFGLAFSLRGVIDELYTNAELALSALGVEGPDAEGRYSFGDGARFRVPTAEDERTIGGLAPEGRPAELFRRCWLSEPTASADYDPPARLERALEALAPVISLAVPTSCAVCGVEQEVEFDIVRYFLAALSRERPLLTREVHALARAYGWSFDDIMRLPRSQRHAHVELIEIERGNLELTG